VALSEREQRLLEEMERNLYQNEADIVSTLGATSRQVNYRAVAIGTVVAVAGLGLMLWGVSSSIVLLGVAGFLVAFAGAMVALAVPGKPRPEKAAPSAGSRSARGTGSFMDQLNERWDQRRRGEMP
jgi:hypothetical protein